MDEMNDRLARIRKILEPRLLGILIGGEPWEDVRFEYEEIEELAKLLGIETPKG